MRVDFFGTDFTDFTAEGKGKGFPYCRYLEAAAEYG